MNEQELRESALTLARFYIGCETGDARHRIIIDTYNDHRPLPRGYKVTYTDQWCATFVSSIAIQADLADIIPLECGCGEMVNLAKAAGIWKGRDYTPKPGDVIMYDWTGKTPGWADHTGFVETDEGPAVVTIEGNAPGGKCARRTVLKSDSQILGYIAPDYAAKAREPFPFLGIVQTDVNLRTAPINLGPFNKCKVDRNDGRGIRSVLYKGETVEIIGESGKWWQTRIKGEVYTWTPWIAKKTGSMEIIKPIN